MGIFPSPLFPGWYNAAFETRIGSKGYKAILKRQLRDLSIVGESRSVGFVHPEFEARERTAKLMEI